jgi:Uma2 family endonuclease
MDATRETLRTAGQLLPPMMQAGPLPQRMSEEEFEAWCDEDVAAEYVNGEVIVRSPVRTQHSELAIFMAAILRLVSEQLDSGRVLGPEVQVRLRPGLRRIPDVMFIANDRAEIIQETRVEGSPDLVWKSSPPIT